LSYKR